MVKFYKHLQSRKVSKWSKKYINYKSLKQIINEIYIKLRISKPRDEGRDLFEPNPTNYYEDPQNRVPSPGNEELSNDGLINKFLTQLDEELQKFYYSYCGIEKDLFVKLNKLLHNKESYNNFQVVNILSECENIYLLTLDTRLFSDYTYINLEAIRKIGKKFDKKIKKYFNNKSLMLGYIKKNLDNRNSDLNYILQLKIVDELFLLINVTLHNLSKRLADLRQENLKKNSLIKSGYRSGFENADSILDFSEKELKVNKYIKEINNNLYQININGQYRIKYFNMGMFFNYENNNNVTSNNHYFLGNDNDFGCFLAMRDKEENLFLVKKFVSTPAFEEMKKENEKMMSESNLQNCQFLIMHRLMTAVYSGLNFGILLALINEYNENGCYLGLGIAVIFIGSLLSKIFFSFLLRKDKFYKISLLSTIILIIISNLFCIGIKTEKEPFNEEAPNDKDVTRSLDEKINEISNISNPNNLKFILLIVSRLAIGFGCGGEIEKKYFNYFMPKNTLYFAIKDYNNKVFLGTTIGLLFGPMVIPTYSVIMVLIILNIIHFAATLLVFKSPSKQGFSILKKDLDLQDLSVYTNEELHSKNSDDPSNENEKEKSGRRKKSLEQEDMTVEESEKVHETNEQLRTINTINQYSDSNLIPTNVTKVLNSYKNNEISKLCCLIAIICVSEFINVSLHVIVPISLINNGYSEISIILMIIPFLMYYVINYLYNNFFSKKKFLRTFLVAENAMLFLMLFLFIFHIYIFIIFYFFLIPINLIIQKKTKRFLSLTFQNDIKIWIFQANSFISVCLKLSQILGALIPLFLNVILHMPIAVIDGLNFILFYFFYVLICLSMMIVVTFLYTKKIDFIKMKMFARMLKRKLY